jgi:hypothetical protein
MTSIDPYKFWDGVSLWRDEIPGSNEARLVGPTRVRHGVDVSRKVVRGGTCTDEGGAGKSMRTRTGT